MNLLLEEAQNDPIKKANLIQDIVQTIAIIPDAIIRSVYIKECSALLGVSEEVLSSELNKKRKKANLEKRKEAERSERKEGQTIENRPLVLTEEIVEAGINSELFERNVIRVIIEHGFRKYDEKILAIDYISEKLQNFKFNNELHQKVFTIALEHRKQETVFDETFFSKLEEDEVVNLAITLTTSPYVESENWYKKFKIPTTNVELTFKKDIDTEIYWLMFSKLEETELIVMEKLKQSKGNIEDEMKYLKMKQKLKEKILLLSKEKGTVITSFK